LETGPANPFQSSDARFAAARDRLRRQARPAHHIPPEVFRPLNNMLDVPGGNVEIVCDLSDSFFLRVNLKKDPAIQRWKVRQILADHLTLRHVVGGCCTGAAHFRFLSSMNCFRFPECGIAEFCDIGAAADVASEFSRLVCRNNTDNQS
jgi:hypothetical protein